MTEPGTEPAKIDPNDGLYAVNRARLWNEAHPEYPRKERAYIVDIDGTLALRSERGPYDMARVGEDTPFSDVVDVVFAQFMTGAHIIFTSGRDDICRAETAEWIRKHLPFEPVMMLMRPTGDKRADDELKREMYETEIEPFYDVKGVFDDRNKVVKMWRKIGLTVFQVADGDF